MNMEDGNEKNVELCTHNSAHMDNQHSVLHAKIDTQDHDFRLLRRLSHLEGREHALVAERKRVRHIESALAESELALEAARRDADRLRNSASWKLTGVFRRLNGMAAPILAGPCAWLLLKPGSRPRRIFRHLAIAFGLSPAVDNGGRPPIPEAPLEAQSSPKRQILYVLIDTLLVTDEGFGPGWAFGSLCAELIDSPHDIRLVKWDDRLSACVLVTRGELDRMGAIVDRRLSIAQLSAYPEHGAGTAVVQPRRRSGSWLIAPATQAPMGPLIQWARSSGLRAGIIFGDGIPLSNGPELMSAEYAQSLRELRGADVVWPISAWSADRLKSFWAAETETRDPRQPVVYPIAMPPEFFGPRPPAPRSDNKLVLCVGDPNAPNNCLALIQAFQLSQAERPASGWELVIVGALDLASTEAVHAAMRIGASIRRYPRPQDGILKKLYEQCAFTVAPGTSEESIRRVLESLWHGRPCVCADFGAIAEAAAQGGCLTVDVGQADALKAAIDRLMVDLAFRNALTEAAHFRPMPCWSEYLSELEASGPGSDTLIYYWVDSTCVVPVNTGIQRVVRQLARGLIEAGFQLVPVKWGGLHEPLQPVLDSELHHLSKWNGPAADDWHGWVSPRTHHGGGWFVMNELPYNLTGAKQAAFRVAAEVAGLRTAAVFYDNIPWKMADLYPAEAAALHRSYMEELANYTKILAISEYSRSELETVLEKEFEIPASLLGNILACPLAAEFPEKAEQAAAPSRRDDGTIEILCIGTVEPRKNHERLLDAFELACQRSSVPLHLTIVGGGHSFDRDLPGRVRARVDKQPRIDWEERADDARIKLLYGHCDFSIYPSVEEGFGMPILESLWYGKPVICANTGAMAEVAEGGGCATIDVTDVNAMATAICNLANSPEERTRLAAEAEGRTFQTWAGYAGEIALKLGLEFGAS